jgi:hypothetical protein
MTELEELIQLLSIPEGENLLDEKFGEIASALMNDWLLQIENEKYRIAELEFYFNSDTHQDSYAHGHSQQKSIGKWYFHGSGIDITIGSQNALGGILIRALQKLPYEAQLSKGYTYGPLNILTEIFSIIPSIESHPLTFGLKKALPGELKNEQVLACPRVGLNPDKDLHQTCNKNYRFLILWNKQHKDKEKYKHLFDLCK